MQWTLASITIEIQQLRGLVWLELQVERLGWGERLGRLLMTNYIVKRFYD